MISKNLKMMRSITTISWATTSRWTLAIKRRAKTSTESSGKYLTEKELIVYKFVCRHQDWEDEEQNEDFLEQLRAEIKK